MRRLGFLLILLTACYTTETVALARRSDGAQAQCGGKKIGWWVGLLIPVGPALLVLNDAKATYETRTCVEDFQRAGYERAPAGRLEASHP